jgi:hypothetical protein
LYGSRGPKILVLLNPDSSRWVPTDASDLESNEKHLTQQSTISRLQWSLIAGSNKRNLVILKVGSNKRNLVIFFQSSHPYELLPEGRRP